MPGKVQRSRNANINADRNTRERSSSNYNGSSSGNHIAVTRCDPGLEPLCMPPIACAMPQVEVFAVRFAYILDSTLPPPAWAFSVDPISGYLMVPDTAAARLSFGFDQAIVKLEDPVGIFNINPTLPPVPPATPINFLPASVTSALFSVVGLPYPTQPFFILKPWNYLTNAKKEWQVNDLIFVEYGPFQGVHQITFIDYLLLVVYVTQLFSGPLVIVNVDFCDSKPCRCSNVGCPLRHLFDAEFRDKDNSLPSKPSCSSSSSSRSSKSSCSTSRSRSRSHSKRSKRSKRAR